jgi:hypothetical protein
VSWQRIDLGTSIELACSVPMLLLSKPPIHETDFFLLTWSGNVKLTAPYRQIKAAPVHSMGGVCVGGGGGAASHPGHISLGEGASVSVKQDPGWASEPVWPFWKKYRPLPLPEIEPRFLGHSVHSWDTVRVGDSTPWARTTRYSVLIPSLNAKPSTMLRAQLLYLFLLLLSLPLYFRQVSS